MSHEQVTTAVNNVDELKSSCSRRRVSRWTTAGGLIAAFGVCSACCLLPAILIALGITGAWIGALESLSRYKWYLVGMTVVLLGYGLVLSYPKKSSCGNSSCASCRPSTATRITLWIGVILALSGLLFEAIEPVLTK